MMIDMKFDIQRIQIEPDDILIGYTDGVIEAVAANGDFCALKDIQFTYPEWE